MLYIITLHRVPILLGLVANYNISIASCFTLDSFDIAGDDTSMLRSDFFPKMHNKHDRKR